jgi:hypothetical protein
VTELVEDFWLCGGHGPQVLGSVVGLVEDSWLCGRLGGRFLALWWAWSKVLGSVVGLVEYSWLCCVIFFRHRKLT